MKSPCSTQKTFVPYRLKNGWTDFQVFGVCGFIWLPWVLIAYLGLPQAPGMPAPTRFHFWPKNSAIWQNEHVTLFEGNGWTDFNEVSGERYECPAAINVIWVITMPRPHGGQPQPVLLFFKTVLPSVGRKMKLGAAVEKTDISLRELDPC